MNKNIFITGGTGYIGSRLIPVLISHGYEVTALTRITSEKKLPSGCKIVFGSPLDKNTFQDKINGCDIFIQLVGVSHPSPAKKEEFKKIDLVSIQQSVTAAMNAGVKHFIYMSVAHQSSLMKDYVDVRLEGERLIKNSGMNATFLKPWYVLGPGHYWPYLFLPFYNLAEIFPPTRESAIRLGLVNLRQFLNAFMFAIENPPNGIRSLWPEQIKKF